MRTRAITGFFFIIVMLASVLLGHYVFGIFYLVLGIYCLWEFYGLVKESGISPNQSIGIVYGFFIYVIFALIARNDIAPNHKLFFILMPIPGAIFYKELFKMSKHPFTNIAYTFTGLVYTVIPFTFFHALAYLGGTFNFHIPLAFLIMLWANDTGAYLVGIKFGRHKLFERHSPKKTWEGFIGGVLISALAAFIISLYFKDLTLAQWIPIAVIISCFGTLGDLVESMLKRSLNIKDSGGILPGHGGVLDRFDGLLFSVPIVYAYLYLITNS